MARYLTVPQAGNNSLRDFCSKHRIACSGYQYETAISTIDSYQSLVVILRNPQARYESGMRFLYDGNNVTGPYVEQHTAPYLDHFAHKAVRYILFENLYKYFEYEEEESKGEDKWADVYTNGELEKELETYNYIIDNNDELTVEEFNQLFNGESK